MSCGVYYCVMIVNMLTCTAMRNSSSCSGGSLSWSAWVELVVSLR